MDSGTVTATGTMKRVSRQPDALPADVIAALNAAQKKADAAQQALKEQVRQALLSGSVRQVAKALGVSPTTVHKWSHEN